MSSAALLHGTIRYATGSNFGFSDSPGLTDFAIALVNSVLNLPGGQVK